MSQINLNKASMPFAYITPQTAMEHMEEEKTLLGVYVVVIPPVFRRLEKRNNALKMTKIRIKRVSRKTDADFSASGYRI